MARHRTSSKRPPPDIGLHMECVEEELEPSQVSFYNKACNEYNEVQERLNNYIKTLKADIIEKGENCMVLQLNAKWVIKLFCCHLIITEFSVIYFYFEYSKILSGPTNNQKLLHCQTTGPKNITQSEQTDQDYQPIISQGILPRPCSNSNNNTYLLMDPNLHFMVSQIQPSNVISEQTAMTSTLKSGV